MKWTLIVALVLFGSKIFASGLEITNLSYDDVAHELEFDIRWDYPWKINTSGTNTSTDGVWIFVKYAANGGPVWQHVDILTATTSFVLLKSEIGNNNKGVMLKSDFCTSGASCTMITRTVTLGLGTIMGSAPDFKVFGIEMVQVPSDDFYLGDGASIRHYHEGPDTLQPFLVNSSDLITVGTGPGELAKKDITLQYDVPEVFPKGYREFWVMKYKIGMEQYVEFLNTLSRGEQNNRTETDVSGNTITETFVMTNTATPYERQPIRCDANQSGGPINFYCDLNNNGIPNENDDGQNLILHTISANDYLAYMDWAALRPMSKMEYVKMCRGPLPPVAYELAWGSAGHSAAGNVLNEGESNETFDNVGIDDGIVANFYINATGARSGYAATATSDRLSSGATFYGIMNVYDGGSMYFDYTLKNLNNIHYFNSQGDGALAPNGSHNESNWSDADINSSISYSQNPISEGYVFVFSDEDTRNSTTSGRGVVILQP